MSKHAFIYRTHFGSFVDFAFRELHPGESMADNWHIRLMANLLEFSWQTSEPEALRRVIFNLPPEYLKTHLCSISLPAWVLGRDPRKSVLIVSETPEHALEILDRCEELMSSRRYRSIFPRMKLRRKPRQLDTSYGGGIRIAGVGHSLPHRSSDLVILDNPQSLHSLDRVKLEPFIEIDRTLKNPKTGLMVVATRRLAANDLSQFLYNLGHWAIFSFPAIALDEKPWVFPPYDDHVQKRGELLHCGLEGWEELESHLLKLGGEAFSYQYLQGEYLPQAQGQRLGTDSQGNVVTLIGSFDRTRVASEDLRKLKQEYFADLLV